MLRPEPLDIVLILIVAALIFGANRLPETARALGKGIREFRDAVTGKDAVKTNDTPDATTDSHHDSN
ncbi:MAG: twin-arginine translocase TatA/TatE family subunit [Chloroflexota bacterium]